MFFFQILYSSLISLSSTYEPHTGAMRFDVPELPLRLRCWRWLVHLVWVVLLLTSPHGCHRAVSLCLFVAMCCDR